VGLPNVLRALRRALAESPQQADIWTPSPLLVRLADEGKTFN
jgi:3-hydroxyacyl-CoA dehydrogenase